LDEVLADLLGESHGGILEESRENERSATGQEGFAVRLYATRYSLREPTAILAELALERSYGEVWN
jgi:hypothetical protein